MAYREINPETKVAILRQYWAGARITHLARHYNVSRDSIYKWLYRANEGINQALFRKNQPSQNK